MKTTQQNPHSLTRRLSIATLALAALTPLAAAIAGAPEVTLELADSSAPEHGKATAPTTEPAPAPKPAPQDADKAKAAAVAKAAEEAARKKCEEDKPKNPCAPRKKKKCE